MLAIVFMLLLVIIGGWLDARLNWHQAAWGESEGESS